MLVQYQILNTIINKKDFSIIDKFGLGEKYFPNLKNEYKFIINHFNQYDTVPDMATMLQIFPSFEVLEVNESINYLVDQIRKEYKENYLADLVKKVRDLVMADKADEAMALLSDASDKAVNEYEINAVDILNDISRYDEYIDRCKNFGKYSVTTGFRELDKSLNDGGIDRINGYFVISARAGYGKTLVMMVMAAAAAKKGLRVGFYEGEMTVNTLGNRYDTISSHISNVGMNKGDSTIGIAYKRYLDELQKQHPGNLFVLTRDNIKDDEVTTYTMRAFIDKYNLDILFVDQFSLLDDIHHGKSDTERAANISKDLKKLQVRKHIPIVAAAQQNRSAIEEGKGPGTENIGVSDRIGQDATVVLFITKKDNILAMHIAKARNGCKQTTLEYAVDFNTCTFTYMPKDEDDKCVCFEAEEEEVTPMNIQIPISDGLPFGNEDVF